MSFKVVPLNASTIYEGASLISRTHISDADENLEYVRIIPAMSKFVVKEFKTETYGDGAVQALVLSQFTVEDEDGEIFDFDSTWVDTFFLEYTDS